MPVLEGVNLREHAYYKTGGKAETVVAPATVQEFADVVRAARHAQRPLLLLGGGTNSLVMDETFPGVAVLFQGLSHLKRLGPTRFLAGAGVENSFFCRSMYEAGLTGAGWMNRLPGQIGGTVRMNARCYGGEISQIARQITVVTTDGAVVTRAGKDVFRGYKDTLFMDNGDLVAEVEFELALAEGTQEKSLAAVAALMKHCEDDRVKKGQFDWPSCGCVFKNDYAVGVPSGMLMEAAGAKTMRRGGVAVSPHHANFVFNQGATAREILEFTFELRERVYDHFGVWMEYEMEVLGKLPEDLARRMQESRANRWDLPKLAPLRAALARRLGPG
jgi:UDP-N-acetylmuramate dehydrogenase